MTKRYEKRFYGFLRHLRSQPACDSSRRPTAPAELWTALATSMVILRQALNRWPAFLSTETFVGWICPMNIAFNF